MLSENIIKGQLIELKVQEEFLRYGFDISIPTYNSSRYDLLVDTGNELLKIQIKKSIGQTEHSFSFACTSQNVRSNSDKTKHKYTKDEIDYFATVWKNKVYLIPIDETSTNKTLRDDGSFDDYLVENIFSNYYRLSDEELYNFSKKGHCYCVDCGCEITINSNRCIACNHKYQSKLQRTIDRPNREELKNLIRTTPFIKIAKLYNVSDNAIRKWCDSEGLPRRVSDIKKITEEDWKLI